MHTDIRLSSMGKYPCLELNAPLMTWNNWMQDNVSLMPGIGENDFEINLFSFQTGTVLSRCRTEQSVISELFNSNCICLAAMSIGNKHLSETTIFKRENFDVSGRFFEGLYLQTSGETEKALKAYTAALEVNPKVHRIHNLIGLCHRLSGNNEQAEKSYLTSIELKAGCPEALSNLGILYMKTGREEEAEKLFCRALEADEFYLNALLRLSQIYMNNRKVLDTDYLKINLKLLQLHFSLPNVQQRLEEAAAFGRLTLEEYTQRLLSTSSCLNSASFAQQMKNVETMILNGALYGAINGLRNLMANAQNTFHHSEVTNWCKNRLERIQKISEKLKHLELYNVISNIQAEFPNLKFLEKTSGHDPLTSQEFFSLVILEIMRDGQIDPPERKMVAKLKELLEISDQRYQEIINSIRAQVCANPFIEREPKGFQPERLFKTLVKAAARDRVIEDSEKKILVFASKAFGISSEDVNRILSEAKQ